ncbi:ABC transporter permease [Actinomadura madurae]|uniref:ABC transporter permease n=1 Tax=Actinomadura madurae TaxID=1993 RepID=UPI0020260503|nr:ABC transporter permease [Actinomadura madurae]MCP9949956.1 ABC transporter permease [Actinomadura madurae]MCP9966713.1 ABC transporter permease [Actinomadura madurae]MCP9979200.1 ABC transporter permease [Actinomadura madurae]MCQ0009273.1 ABC transporter permease [Actinomadura madurae]MCQ0015391.1 ABC transporter permease [Actinomadura madurae]
MTTIQAAPPAVPGTVREGWRRYLAAVRSPRGAFALSLLALLVLAALLVPLFSNGYDRQSSDTFLSPSWRHLFGTDELGRDVFTRTLYGLRTDLVLLFVGVPVSMVLGTLLGVLGAMSRAAGLFMQRVFDIIIGFPSLILGIVIVLIMGSGVWALLVTIVVYGLPGFGRLARAAMLTQERREYVLAARVLGISRWKVLVRHILPNSIDAIIVHAAISMVIAIFLETGLSIVGLGIQPPQPSLGMLLNTGVRFLSLAPMYVLGPTLVLILLALSFSLLSDALNEAVNRK